MAGTSSVTERISFASKTSRSLTKQEVRDAERLCCIGQKGLDEATGRLIDGAEHGTVSQHASADGTPMSVSVRVQASLPSGTTVQRRGKATHEFLSAVQFARSANAAGDVESVADIRPPRPLTNGKKAQHIFEA
eukprot:6836870-Pyramimonas_sp.AAC.1